MTPNPNEIALVAEEGLCLFIHTNKDGWLTYDMTAMQIGG